MQKPRLLVIASGNGGVGKTWLSLTLAQAFGQRRSRVLVLDADGGETKDTGQAPSVPGEMMPAEALDRSRVGGFDLLTGRIPADAVRAELESKSSYDTVILDLSSGFGNSGRCLAALADTILLVVTPDPASLTDAYAVLKLLKGDRRHGEARTDIRIIVNQAPSIEAGKRAYSALSRAARRFLRLDPPLLGIIGHDEQVPATTDEQKLQLARFPQSKAGLEVQMIARRLMMKS